MEFNKTLYRSPQTLHFGCEKPRAYFIPYGTEASAANDITVSYCGRGGSEFFKRLCGEWKFRWLPSADAITDLEKEFSDITDTITVPMSWQANCDKGYDVPQYTNINYPFPCEPPYIPDDIPCGLYERSFNITGKQLSGKRIFLNFEGVDAAFYIWINGSFTGYSQVSHMTSEMDITPLVKAGKNEIRVLVVKWCDSSYLEDQDMWRMSGIFREVYLLFRDECHISDVFIRTQVPASLDNAKLSAEISYFGEKRETSYKLISPTGKALAAGTAKDGLIALSLENPALWNDENPLLYMLFLHCGNEFIKFDVGFRRLEIKNRTVLLNGKKFKSKGVNRHDSHPILGHATPFDHMLEDLLIMKRSNINMVRTSHYPNDPRMPELCDRLSGRLETKAVSEETTAP